MLIEHTVLKKFGADAIPAYHQCRDSNIVL